MSKIACKLILTALKIYYKTIFLIIWPIVLFPIFLSNEEFNTPTYRCFYVLCLMGGFWILEVLPAAVTALLPMALFPFMEISPTDLTAINYFAEANMMFIGGLMVALGIEYSNLHTRISLLAIKVVGCGYRRLNFGLVFLTMFVSMWISNTAATAMMLPIIRAVLTELEAQGLGKMFEDEVRDNEPKRPTRITMCFYISTAYAASIGGLGCIVGSGTNLTLKGTFDKMYVDHPEGAGVEFTDWLALNVLLMLLIMFPSWVWMQFWYMGLFRPNSEDAKAVNIGKEGEEVTKTVLNNKLKEMGKFSLHEILVGLLFVAVVLLWFFRSPGWMPGWAKAASSMKVKDATAAMIVVFVLFLLPFGKKTKGRHCCTLLIWEYVHKKLHWNLTFLLGGGFALSFGIRESGLDRWLAEKLQSAAEWDKFAIMVVLVVVAMVLTQFTANVVVAQIFLPLASSMADEAGIHPLYLMMPVCLACSFAFMLPVATPPNAIVAAPSNMKTIEMIKVGAGVQLIAFVMLIFLFPTLGMMAIWSPIQPDWAWKNRTI